MTFSTLRGLGLGLLLAASAAHSAVAQTWQSVVTPNPISNVGTLTVNAMAFDAAGNIVVTGSFTGTVQLGFFSLTSVGGSDVFIAKLSPAGVWLLASRAGGSGADQATALARDSNNEFVVTGQFGSPTFPIGSTTLSNTTATGNITDIFVARWTTIGNWDAAVSAGSVSYDYATGVALDGGGTATVVGSFTGATFTAGAFTLTNAVASGASTDLFAVRLDDTGDWTQAARIGGTGDESASAVAVTTGGEVVVAGSFTSASLVVDGTTLINASQLDPETDALVAWLSAAGTWTRAVQAGAAGSDNLRAIRVEAGGGIVVAGDFTGTTTLFGTQTLTNADPSGVTSDIVVARLSAAGTWTQAVQAGSIGLDYTTSLAAGASGGTVLTGTFGGPALPLGAVTLTNAASGTVSSDVFVARLDAAGSWAQALQAGGAGDDYATAVLADAQGKAYVGGVTSNQGAQFGPVAVPTGAATGFIALLGGLPTATRAQASIAAVTLSPNPLSAGMTASLAYELPTAATVRLDVLDAVGRPVTTQSGQVVSAGAHTLPIETAHLATGLYLVRLQIGEQATFQRLVVE